MQLENLLLLFLVGDGGGESDCHLSLSLSLSLLFYLFVYCLSCLNINRFFYILFFYNCFSMFHLFSSLARTSC